MRMTARIVYQYIYDQFNWGPKPGIRPGNDRCLIGYLLGCINLFDGGYGGMSFWDFALNQSVEGTWWIPWFLVQGLVSSLQNFRCFSLPTGFGDFQRGFHDPCSDTPWLPQMSSLGVARKTCSGKRRLFHVNPWFLLVFCFKKPRAKSW